MQLFSDYGFGHQGSMATSPVIGNCMCQYNLTYDPGSLISSALRLFLSLLEPRADSPNMRMQHA